MAIRTVVLFFSFLLYSKALIAAPILDTVTIEGREWAQPDLFAGVTWNNINTVCPGGVCGSGLLNGWDMQGWMWASYADMAALFNPYVERDGGNGEDLLSEFPDLYAFFFDENSFTSPTPYEFFEETLLRPTDTYFGRVCGRISCVDDEVASLVLDGWLSDQVLRGFRPEGAYASFQALGGVENFLGISSTVSFGSDVRNTPLDTNTRDNLGGGWFYQTASVPSPGTLWLLSFALLLLARRRRA